MAVEHPTTKRCTKCGENKPLTDFYKDSQKSDGLAYRCKDCVKSIVAKWNADHPGRAKERTAKYRAENPDKVKEADAKWRAANPDYSAKWAAAHPEAVRIRNQNSRARKRAAGGKLSKGLADKLFRLQKGKCACGCKQNLGTDYHLDHIMPLALGGSNTDNNIQLLRAECNLQKNAKHPVDFMQIRGFLL